jgi:hypothetical protein
MTWDVEFEDEFETEFDDFTLNGSEHANMKELRFNADDGVWRVAFAFDPERKAILRCGGDKEGKDQKRFYKDLIRIADRRFNRHLKRLMK